jgi:hypothetical protein
MLPGRKRGRAAASSLADFTPDRRVHTDYRRPLSTFRQTISTVVALHFYALGE